MPLFVSAPGATSVHGVFATEAPPPATVTATGTNVAVIVGQFPWGPSEKLTYPSTMGEFFQTFAPAGMTRTGSAHLSVIRKAWPILGAVRVADPTAVAASATFSSSTPTSLFTVTLNSMGTQGNSVIGTIGTADDANSNHFNLTLQVSSASGTTTEIYRNLNISGTGTDVTPDFSQSVLAKTFTKLAAGIPVAGNTTFSGGTNGTITSSLYVGTPGANDDGFALLEGDSTISHVFTDDPGNSLRAAVNAGLEAHAELTTDRLCYLNGNSGQTASQAQTDVANYRSIRCVYVDPWAYVFDDTDGTMRLAPSSCWAASVAAQLQPSTSIAWKADAVAGMLAGIAQLEFDRGSSRGQNTASGISTLIKRATGGFAFEAAVNTSLTAGQTIITRTRMGQYIARSVVEAWQPYVDAPNVPFFQQDLLNSLDVFLGQLKLNKELNPAFLPYIVNYAIQPTSASNTTASIQGGNFTVAAQVETGADMSKIFLQLQYGPTVTVQAA